jgi:succinate dehydrogenase hydrophobic anchor subunit
MLSKNRLPLLIVLICVLEVLVYFWAVWSTEAEFVFDKCARNSGRVSSAIILATLLMIAYYGLKKIYLDTQKLDAFRVLISLFTVNHLIHFSFVYMNLDSHATALSIDKNKHGFVTFICIVLVLIIVWSFKKLNNLLYTLLLLHLFNVSYFIMETFYHKVKPDKPAYHNQLGIVVISAALIYILYRVFEENRKNSIQG